MDNIQYKDSQQSKVGQVLPVESHQIFDSMVTRDYLHSLSLCKVKPLVSTSYYSKVRWFRVDKIVMEKDVFFADKLSMLYMSLHKTAKNIILVLNKQNDGDIELYLGARDFSGNRSVSGKILEAGLVGYFPGIRFEQKGIGKLNFTNPSVTSVSAIASLRDDKKEDFVQGIERLINATSSIPQFRAYFVADSVGDAEVNGMISAFSNLYSSLSPAETLQMTFNESETKGVSESFTENFSESIGESISKTVTHTDGYSENYTESDTKTECESDNNSENIIKTKWNSLVGGKTGGSTNHSSSSTQSQTIGKNFSDSEAYQKGSNRNTTKGTADQKGTNESTTTGSSKQITYKNRTVKFYLDIMDKQLERLQNGRPFGLWSVATYFVANDPTTAQQLSNIYRGSIIGEESGLETCAINTWKEEKKDSVEEKKDSIKKIIEYLENSLHPRFDFNSLDVSAGSVVNSKELAIHLSLPQSSVPGIIVQECASFARNVFSTKNNSNEIHLGEIVHLGQVSKSPVNLDIDELTKHTFVTGTTGSGKSNTLYLLLNGIIDKGKKFLVIEPAKGEYKHVFGNKPGVFVYGSNPNMNQLLRINPFEFPEGVHVYEHIDRLVEIFNACWPMYAAMPVVLKKAITDAYKQCGWDLYSSNQVINCTRKLFPTVNDVVVALRDFINNSEYSAETKGDYKGSLETRLISMSEGLTGMMLNNTKGIISDSDLFQENVIVDLSRVGNTETKALIMGLLIMKMNEFYQTQGKMNSSLNHITVLEEAHNLLKRTSTTQSQESSNLAGKSVEMICNSIAEMRTYGEGFIIVDQSPSQVDLAAIRNTNTKIILSLPEADDRECAGKSIGLKDEQIDEIGRLKMGEAIVYQNDWEEPVQCKVNESEYNKEERYKGHKNPCNDIDESHLLYEVLSFLYMYCGGSNDTTKRIDDLKNSILDCKLLSATKFSLLKLIDDYNKNGVDLNKRNHAKVMETVGACLGLSPQIKKIIMKKGNITEANDSIKDLIINLLPNGSDDFYRFCTRCSLRLLASESSTNVDFYNNWFRMYYK